MNSPLQRLPFTSLHNTAEKQDERRKSLPFTRSSVVFKPIQIDAGPYTKKRFSISLFALKLFFKLLGNKPREKEEKRSVGKKRKTKAGNIEEQGKPSR